MKKNPPKQTALVTVEISSRKFPFTKRELSGFTAKVLTAIRKNRHSVNLYVVRSPKMKAIHKKFFNDPSDTDCMSFSQFEGKPVGEGNLLGDVFVCWDQVKRQAPQFGNKPEEELLYCIIHGILHLIGHDDLKPAPRKKMFQLQDKLFKRFRNGYSKNSSDRS